MRQAEPLGWLARTAVGERHPAPPARGPQRAHTVRLPTVRRTRAPRDGLYDAQRRERRMRRYAEASAVGWLVLLWTAAGAFAALLVLLVVLVAAQLG